ncbi:HipA N-terminal domain-containing protein [Nostoc ellipsosporum NOK]|nr:HipA N-terminal domain-containing protein [Nostoc ellipsosporum NOK]
MVTNQTRIANVFYNDHLAGTLQKEGRLYTFTYNNAYRMAGGRPISITMPLREEPYKSDILFPVFTNMLSEGANKKMQCRMLKIDENDYFSLLLATTKEDSIGPITVKETI